MSTRLRPSGPTGSEVHRAPPGALGTRKIRGLDADQRRAQRRDQILDAAFGLFARDGYAKASIEEICQRAYVGNKAFYEVFDSKEDCYLALHNQIGGRIQEAVSEEFRQACAEDAELADTVHRLLSGFVHALVDDPRVMMVGFGDAAGISRRIAAQRRATRRSSTAFVEAVWRRNRAAVGVADDPTIDYHLLAVACIGGLFEMVADWLHDYEPAQLRSVDTLIADMTAFMLAVETGAAARAKR